LTPKAHHSSVDRTSRGSSFAAKSRLLRRRRSGAISVVGTAPCGGGSAR
jgi:hypothetical protein